MTKLGSEILNSERPSSYPGIWKHPSGRHLHFQSILDWINGKRQDDDLNGLWRIHDKIYDLQTFVKHHPGGSDWLEFTKGMDITEAFEISHVENPKFAERTLKTYYVCNATSRRFSPYTFEENGFYKVLKERIQPIIKAIGTGPTNQIQRMMDSVALLFILMTVAAITINSTILQILTGLTLAMNNTASHNFLHLRENWRKFYFDFSLASSYEFRMSHAFSHHLFPNTILDFEVSSYEPLLEFLPKRNKTLIQRYGPIMYIHFVYLVNFLIIFVNRWRRVLSSQQDFRPEYLLVLVHLLFCLVISTSITSGLTGWLTIHFSASYFFNLVTINAGHHHPMIFHDGDEARPNPDFGLCQLDAVRDRCDSLIQKSLFVQLICFGEHPLHHLFPTICLSKLKYLKPIFLETLEEFQETFPPCMTQLEHFYGTLAQLRRIRRKGRTRSITD